MRNLGIEPRAPRWQRRILPLNQLRLDAFRVIYLRIYRKSAFWWEADDWFR
jgi:hypothetical protein